MEENKQSRSSEADIYGDKYGSISNAVKEANLTYSDLVLTAYPKYYDGREQKTGYFKNLNLLRQTNLKHYNMAEHVNALQDAVMAIQRTLGVKAQLPAKPVDKDGNPITSETEINKILATNTVKDRIDALEKFDWYAVFDKRYGGPNWKFDKNSKTNPTIEQHRHTGGGNGMPAKISLTQEVSGKLPKANLDLGDAATSLTGSDIRVVRSKATKISEALDDKISETTGGTIQQSATLINKGKTQTRTRAEYDYTDGASGNTKVSDANTLLGMAMESPTTTANNLLWTTLNNLHHGRYVAMFRISSASLANTNLVELAAYDYSSGSNVATKRITLKGTDFEEKGKYKTFYMIFDHDGKTRIRCRKLETTSSAKIRFDYCVVEPVHPAVFDR